MGRFSKLETGQAAEQPAPESTSGLDLPKARKRTQEQLQQEPAGLYDRQHYEQRADDAFYSGDFQTALRQYSRAMTEDNNSPGPWVGQVLALAGMKQHKEAAVWASRAAAMFPQEPRVLSVQGLTLACNQAPQRAISCSDTALKYVTRDTEAFVWAVRGRILSLSDNANSSFCFDKALELKPADDWKVPAWIGMMLLDDRKFSRAAHFLSKAIEINPSNGHLWVSLGKAHAHSGMNEQAMKAYRSALELNPNDRAAETAIAGLMSTPLHQRLWRKITGGETKKRS